MFKLSSRNKIAFSALYTFTTKKLTAVNISFRMLFPSMSCLSAQTSLKCS